MSLTIAALPSFGRLDAPLAAKLGYALALYLTPRTFYYCLVHWTGAEPAEHFSVLRRERYREYQRSTRVLWPFEAPLVDHGRRDRLQRPHRRHHRRHGRRRGAPAAHLFG